MAKLKMLQRRNTNDQNVTTVYQINGYTGR